MTSSQNPRWAIASPVVGFALLGASLAAPNPWLALALGAALITCVLASVHHAEVVAHRIGEPLGTLILALAVTVIEVALIVSLMVTHGEDTGELARDSVFASIIIILNGMVGLCLLVGASHFREQEFGLLGVNATLATIAAISVIAFILPNATVTTVGPSYSASQLLFVATVSVILYGVFVLVQTVRHREYFLPLCNENLDEIDHAHPPTAKATILAATLLLVCLGAVILLAESLAPSIEFAVESIGAPKAVVGVIVAAIVLLPESLSALKAARANRLQTSLNLALGSTMATIGLTLPVIALVSLAKGWTLVLGIDHKSTILLGLSLLVATLSLGTGKTTVLQGAIHLVIFGVFLFTTVVP
jgi:Ca2+:H+ antiporter